MRLRAVLAEAEFTRGCYGACAKACSEAPDRCVAEAGLKGWLAQAEAKQQAAAADVDRFKEVDRRAVECPETPEVVGLKGAEDDTRVDQPGARRGSEGGADAGDQLAINW